MNKKEVNMTYTKPIYVSDKNLTDKDLRQIWHDLSNHFRPFYDLDQFYKSELNNSIGYKRRYEEILKWLGIYDMNLNELAKERRPYELFAFFEWMDAFVISDIYHREELTDNLLHHFRITNAHFTKDYLILNKLDRRLDLLELSKKFYHCINAYVKDNVSHIVTVTISESEPYAEFIIYFKEYGSWVEIKYYLRANYPDKEIIWQLTRPRHDSFMNILSKIAIAEIDV